MIFRIQCLLLLSLVCLLGCATATTTKHTASAPSVVIDSKQPIRFIPYGRDDASVTLSQKQAEMVQKQVKKLWSDKKVELVKDHSVMANGVFLVEGQVYMWAGKYLFCWNEKRKEYHFLSDDDLRNLQTKLDQTKRGRAVDDLSREEWLEIFEALGK